MIKYFYLGERLSGFKLSGLFLCFTCIFKYINEYFHIFEYPKLLFVCCNNHIVFHGWCKYTSLCLVAIPASISNAVTKIFLLPCQVTSSSPKWAAYFFRSRRVIIVILVVPLNTNVWKWFLSVLFLTKQMAIRYAENPFVVYVNLVGIKNIFPLSYASWRPWLFHAHISSYD